MRFDFDRLACIVVAASLAPGAALAHDPPRGTGVFRNGEQLVVRTNRGLVVSDDGETDFRLLCNEALGITVTEVPSIVPTPDGRWLVGTSSGLQLWSADFCSVEGIEPLDRIAVPALAQDLTNPARIYASTGQGDQDNGLYLSESGGETFEASSDQAPDRIYEHVDVSFANPTVMYASGLRLRDDMSGFDYFFGVSLDEGRSFVLSPFELMPAEYGIELFAGDRVAENRMYGVAHAELGTDALDRFLVSVNDGASFDVPLTAPRIAAFAQAIDTLSVFVGATSGLFRSTNQGQSFTQLSAAPVYCLAHDEQGLWACDEADGVGGVVRSTDQGATLERFMTFTDVANPVNCGAESMVAAICAAPWADWQRELLAPTLDAGTGDDDAGPADSGTAGSAGPVSNPQPGGGSSRATDDDDESGCACSSVGGPGAVDFEGSALVVALAWLSMRRWRLQTRRRVQSARDTQGARP